jgi:hypothetical protein
VSNDTDIGKTVEYTGPDALTRIAVALEKIVQILDDGSWDVPNGRQFRVVVENTVETVEGSY